MLPLDARRLAEAHARLFDRTTRFVGWGSGSVFDYFHTRYPLPLRYLVDNDASRWGTRRQGVPIVSPEQLRHEHRGDAAVVIYSSAWPEIQRQAQALGDLTALPASAMFAEPAVRERLARADELAAMPPQPRHPRFDRTVVVQGPVWRGVTPQVLRVLRALHPGNAVVLSTWEDTDLDTLAEAAALADDVVLSARPLSAGIQNRNAQIVSTRAGIERAAASGARTILKTRTDLAVMAPSVFEQAEWWLERIGRSAARAYGLRDRIIVPASFTRKFLLYHPSDLVMLGAADDLRRYWSAPLDARTGELLSPQWLDRPLADVNMDGNPTESYLGLQFCRAIGRPACGTVRDSWDFYRDLFAVVDNDWFEMLWFKNLAIPDENVRRGVRQMVTQAFWQRLQADDVTVDAELAGLDVHQTLLRALSEAA